MKPEDALNVLDNAAGSVSANRATHIKIQNAADVLREFINQKDGQKTKKTKKKRKSKKA